MVQKYSENHLEWNKKTLVNNGRFSTNLSTSTGERRISEPSIVLGVIFDKKQKGPLEVVGLGLVGKMEAQEKT